MRHISGGLLLFAALPLISGAEEAQAPADAGLQEIVVTAQRREEGLQHAAIAVSAISGEALSQSVGARPEDLSQLVPALQVATAAGPYPLFYVRGVGNFNGNSLSDSALAFNVDGVYISRPSSTNGVFYDVARVEVLKGPQGILYGRNATGGAINVITNRPSFEGFGGYATAEFGNYADHRFEAAVNLPLNNVFAARFAGQTIDHSGYLSDGTDDAKDRAGRAELLFKPDDSLSILTTADYYHQGGTGAGATLLSSKYPGFLNGNPRIGLTDPRVSAQFAQEFYFLAGDVFGPLLQKTLAIQSPARLFQKNDFWGISSTIDWKTDAGTLTVVPAYRGAKIDYVSDTPSFLIQQPESDRQYSVEARFASPQDRRLTYLAGVYYLNESDHAAPIYDQQYNQSTQNFAPRTKSYAAFSRLAFTVTDGFRIVGGARYTYDKKDFTGVLTSSSVICPGSFVPPVAGGPFFCFGGVGQITVPTAPIVLDTDRSWNKVTWQAGVEWDVTSQSLLYANVGTGFKAGGFFFSHDNPTYQPEELKAYTVGSKNRFLDNHLQLNAEAFYWQYRNQQLSHISADSTGTVIFPTENVGRATMKGAEIEMQYLPIQGTLLGADLQYLNSVYDRFAYTVPNFGAPPVAACPFTPAGPVYALDCSGKTPPEAPRWTLNLNLEQTIPLGSIGSLVGRADTHFQSVTLTGQEFLPQEEQHGYWVSDASLSYRSPQDKWEITGFVNNLADRQIIQSTFPHALAGADLIAASLRPPRTYGARFRVNF